MFNNISQVTNSIRRMYGHIQGNEWRWASSDFPETYKLKLSGDFKTCYNEEDFSYKLNSNNFRCGEFSDIDINKPIFVVTGDSFTYGVGLPLEDTWGYKIFSKLKEEIPTIQFINLSESGVSLDFTVRALSTLLNILPHIDFCFNLLTEISRSEIVTDVPTSGSIFPFSFNNEPTMQWITTKEQLHIHRGYERSLGVQSSWYQYGLNKNLLILDLLSRLHNFPCVCDFWQRGMYNTEFSLRTKHCMDEISNLIDSRFNYMFPNIGNGFLSGHLEKIPEEDLNARDKYHPGKFYHARYVEQVFPFVKSIFLESIKKKGKLV